MSGQINDEILGLLAFPRPRTRGECVAGVRPCPFASCRFNLLLEVVPASSSRRYANALKLAPDRDGVRKVLPGTPVDESALDEFFDAAFDRLLELGDTCAIDIADRGQHTAAEVAAIVGVTPGQIRNIERAHRLALIRAAAEDKLAA